MSNLEQGQVISSAAAVYEQFFVPALFGEWTDRVINAACLEPGQRVLDVATGTGVLARDAARRVGNHSAVVGLDINEGMLAVARANTPEITWRLGLAEAIPYADHAFDAVISQFGLMFFQDRHQAIREMLRVLRPGGRLAVAVWDELENTPGYLAVTELRQHLFGPVVADALRAPFALGDKEVLGALFASVGLKELTITTHTGTARFPSIGAWMYTDIKGWTLADRLDEADFALLRREAELALRDFVNQQGEVTFAAPGHIVAGRA